MTLVWIFNIKWYIYKNIYKKDLRSISILYCYYLHKLLLLKLRFIPTHQSDPEYQGDAMADFHAKAATQKIPNVPKL